MLSFLVKFCGSLQMILGKKPGITDFDLHLGAPGFWPQERVGDVVERTGWDLGSATP